MKHALIIIFSLVSSASFATDGKSREIESKVIGEAYGDLDKDGMDEKVIILDTGLEGEGGTQRVILIYKKINEKWAMWHSSHGAVLASSMGGPMGDPFDGIEIDRGSIVINHFGGNRQKWSSTYRYRLQNSVWKLIGATIDYGTPCEGFVSFDYNLSTGKAIYKESQDVCPDNPAPVDMKWKEVEQEISVTILDLPDMDGFEPGSNEIEIEQIGKKVYY